MAEELLRAKREGVRGRNIINEFGKRINLIRKIRKKEKKR